MKYEYADFNDYTIYQLNKMGKDGWKVITAVFVPGYKNYSGWCDGGWCGLAMREIEDDKTG